MWSNGVENERGGKWDQPEISLLIDYSLLSDPIFPCPRSRNRTRKTAPHTHTLCLLAFCQENAQNGETVLGCRAEVFNIRIKRSFPIPVWNAFDLEPSFLFQTDDGLWRSLRRMAECSVEQALESQLYSGLAYCCVCPSSLSSMIVFSSGCESFILISIELPFF